MYLPIYFLSFSSSNTPLFPKQNITHNNHHHNNNNHNYNNHHNNYHHHHNHNHTDSKSSLAALEQADRQSIDRFKAAQQQQQQQVGLDSWLTLS